MKSFTLRNSKTKTKQTKHTQKRYCFGRFLFNVFRLQILTDVFSIILFLKLELPYCHDVNATLTGGFIRITC